jgi:hypothetical protein
VYSCIEIHANIELPFAGLVGFIALIIGVAITWLRPFRVLYA